MFGPWECSKEARPNLSSKQRISTPESHLFEALLCWQFFTWRVTWPGPTANQSTTSSSVRLGQAYSYPARTEGLRAISETLQNMQNAAFSRHFGLYKLGSM